MSRLSISSSFLVYCHLRCSLDGNLVKILLNLVNHPLVEDIVYNFNRRTFRNQCDLRVSYVSGILRLIIVMSII